MASPLNKLAGWLSKATAAGAGGAAVGAGVGAAVNPDDPWTGAEIGAGTGALAGPLGLGAERGFTKLVRPTARYLLTNPESQGRVRKNALDEILEVLKNDEMDPSALRHRIDAGAGHPLTLADVGGENLLMRADNAAQIPGPSRNQARAALTPRFEEQPERVRALTKQYLTPSIDADMATKDIQDLKRTQANTMYAGVYNATPQVNSPELDAIMPRLQEAGAVKNAARLAGISGILMPSPQKVLLPDGTTKEVYSGLSGQQLDQVKRGLDDAIAAAKRAGAGEELRALTQLKHEYLGVLDPIMPGYEDARKTFAGYSSSQSALEEGTNFDKGRLSDTMEFFNSLDPGDQEFFRMGVGQRIGDLVASGKEGQDAVKLFFTKRENRSKLRLLFPDEPSYNAFSEGMGRELNMARVNNSVLGGSPSYKRLAEGANRQGGILGNLLSGGNIPSMAMNAAMHLAGSSADRLENMTGAEVTRMLLNPNLHLNRQTIESLQNRQRMQRIGQIVSGGIQAGAAAAPAAGAAALMASPLPDPDAPPRMAEGGKVESPPKAITQNPNRASMLARILGADDPAPGTGTRGKDMSFPVLGTNTYQLPTGESTDVGITDFMIPFADELDAYLGAKGDVGLAPKRWEPMGRGLPNPHSSPNVAYDASFDDAYTKRLGLERDSKEKFRGQHPYIGAAGDALSYVPMAAMAPETAVAGLARLIPGVEATGAMAPLSRAATSAAGLGSVGGLYGFDAGEGGLKNRLASAGVGALQAAAFGPLGVFSKVLSKMGIHEAKKLIEAGLK